MKSVTVSFNEKALDKLRYAKMPKGAYETISTRRKTQKAAGVEYLHELHVRTPRLYGVWPEASFSEIETKIHASMNRDVYTQESLESIFVRPCPTNPQHGFIEGLCIHPQQLLTRPLERICELLKAKLLACDPNGELMFMKYIEASTSGILTSNRLTLGKGTSGATSGRGGGTTTFIIPETVGFAHEVPVVARSPLIKKPIDYDAVKVPDQSLDFYYEFVIEDGRSDKQEVLFTQMRPGPKLSSASEYIPMTILPTTSYDCRHMSDLPANHMDYNKKITRLKANTSVIGAVPIIYAPHAPLTSHYAIQAVITGITFITNPVTFQKLGKAVISSNENASSLPQHRDYHTRFAKTLLSYLITIQGEKQIEELYGLQYARHNTNYNGLTLAAGIIHNHASMVMESTTKEIQHRNAHLLAVAIVLLLRFSISVCIGESRHRRHAKQYSKYRPYKYPMRATRHEIYYESFSRPMGPDLDKFPDLARGYAIAPVWESGFGGYKWGHATAQVVLTASTIRQFIQTPTTETYTNLLTKVNALLASVHNGGYLLNKFIKDELLDLIADLPYMGLIHPAVLEITKKSQQRELCPFPPYNRNKRFYAAYLGKELNQHDIQDMSQYEQYYRNAQEY